MATNSHISVRGARRRIFVALAVASALVAGGLGKAATNSSASGRVEAQASYGWPVKPFDRQHPVRANFGDPRTVFAGPPNQQTLLHGAGTFQFHFGIDVSAPDGTAVYPVVSGRVALVNKDWLAVDAGDDRIFSYWHIAPAVAVG